MTMRSVARCAMAAGFMLAMSLGAPAGAATADPAALAAARSLLGTMHSETMATKMLEVIGPQMINALTSRSHVSREKALAAWQDVLEPAMKSHVAELTDALAEVYAENFTVSEMADIAAFYGTPTGHKLIEKQPLVGSESFAIGQAWGRRVGQDAFTKNQDELRKRGITL